MKREIQRTGKMLVGIAAIALAFGLSACEKKTDPAVRTSSGGGVSGQAVMTIRGAAR